MKEYKKYVKNLIMLLMKKMREAVENHKISGDGPFTKKCDEWMEKRFNANKIMLTTSGSAALDMAAFLCDLKPGDEVILPSCGL